MIAGTSAADPSSGSAVRVGRLNTPPSSAVETRAAPSASSSRVKRGSDSGARTSS